MRLPQSVRDNLYFLLAETSSQVGNLQTLLESCSPRTAQQILDRRGYSHNLKMRIHDGCIEEVHNTRAKDELETYSLRAAEAIASELDRLTELVHDCVHHLLGKKRRRVFKALSSAKLLNEVLGGIQLTRIGLEEERTKPAVKLGQVARKVSKGCEAFLQRESSSISNAKHSQDVIAALFVAQRLSEMGNILIEISGAILSARLGHPLNMDRFRFLESAFEDLGVDSADVRSVAETNSGSGVSGIAKGNGDGYAAIFKDGQRKKLKEERESVESWHEVFPGLAPQILSYRQSGPNASLLIEHLPGYTFEQVLLTGGDELLAKTIKHLKKTLNAVWSETKQPKECSAQYMSQLQKRIDSVREIHDGFGVEGGGAICGANVYSCDQLMKAAAELETEVAPFSVYIHGDFNLDNIIFDPAERSIRFIDLHRSRYSDYVQDVSVFMVSNYRLQALDARTRRRIKTASVKIYEFAGKFARHNGDETFERRLAFGLARSFISSTRFILDKSLAKNMYLRGCYILERIVEQGKTGGQVRLPIRELFS